MFFSLHELLGEDVSGEDRICRHHEHLVSHGQAQGGKVFQGVDPEGVKWPPNRAKGLKHLWIGNKHLWIGQQVNQLLQHCYTASMRPPTVVPVYTSVATNTFSGYKLCQKCSEIPELWKL